MSAQLTIKIPVWLDFLFTCPLLAFRLLRYGYTFRRIYLGDGEFTILDPKDYYLYSRFKWSVAGHDGKFYAVRGIKTGRKKMKLERLHRIIINAPDGLFVDHKNGNSLDNRRDNLRLATSSQNHCNKIIDKSKSSSQYRGVIFRKKSGRYIAQITYKETNHYLGSFDNEIDAAKAYDAAARKHHGDFARLNFPQDLAGACPPKL